jgi:iron complex transport system permease protein
VRPGALIAGLAALVAALFALSVLTGPAGIGPGQALRALLAGDGGAAVLVMREIRLPRAVLAVLVGAALGLRCRGSCGTRWPSRGFWVPRRRRRWGR